MEVRQIEHPEVALHVVAIRVDNEKAGASCSGLFVLVLEVYRTNNGYYPPFLLCCYPNNWIIFIFN